MNKTRKTYVLDASVVIEDPDVFSKLSGDIVIATAVILLLFSILLFLLLNAR
jgi:predicted ribonuclease YlaK